MSRDRISTKAAASSASGVGSIASTGVSMPAPTYARNRPEHSSGRPCTTRALTKALAHHPGRLLIVDLDGVTLLDDTGLGVLLGAAGSARQTGTDLFVVCNNQRLRERLDTTGFSRAVEVRERLRRGRS